MPQLDRKIYPLFTEIAKQKVKVCKVLQFDFQNTLQDNSSADKNKTNQTSNAFRENEQTLQTQSHSEKGKKRQKSPFPIHIFLKNIVTFLCKLTKTSLQLPKKLQTTL